MLVTFSTIFRADAKMFIGNIFVAPLKVFNYLVVPSVN